MPSLGGWELVIILVVLLLLFGAKKLPDMARSVGQSARVFKGEMKGLKEDGADAKSDPKTESTPQAQAVPQELPTAQPAPQQQGDPTVAPGRPQDRGTGSAG